MLPARHAPALAPAPYRRERAPEALLRRRLEQCGLEHGGPGRAAPVIAEANAVVAEAAAPVMALMKKMAEAIQPIIQAASAAMTELSRHFQPATGKAIAARRDRPDSPLHCGGAGQSSVSLVSNAAWGCLL
ncbi:hypothetical protein [Streptomyces sp. NPDC001880]